MFYAQEVEEDKEWLFESALICCRGGGEMPKTWRECSEYNDIPCHHKLADDSGRVENVVMKVKKTDPENQGQEMLR